MKRIWMAIAISLTGTIANSAEAINLYNGSGLPANNTPQSLVPAAICASNSPPTCSAGGVIPIQVAVSETVIVGEGVQLTTNANSAEYSGYSNYNPLPLGSPSFFNSSVFNSNTLDRNNGYAITFSFRLDTVNNEVVGTNPRAVFSIIAISSDRIGIELGFRANQIFSQSSNFTSAVDTASFDTTSLKTYKLGILGDNYTLENITNPITPELILGGSLVDYTFSPASSSPPLPFNPYETQSFLFFGDSTGQADGQFTLGAVDLAIPFDFSPNWGIFTVGAIAGIRHLHHRRRQNQRNKQSHEPTIHVQEIEQKTEK